MRFRHHPAQEYEIDSIASRLTDEENAVRLLLMESTIERGEPITPRALTRGGVLQPEAEPLIERLIEKRAVVQDEEGHLSFIFPVSALPTRHRVSLKDGRRFFAMCAVDAMGTAFTFDQDVEIESECSECGAKIAIGIERGELAVVVPPTAHVLHVDLEKVENWAGAA
jgi:hypothetical protein